MARGWKPTSKDYSEFTHAWERAYQAINSTIQDLTSAGFDFETVEEYTPYLSPEIQSVEELKGTFVSRADYNRELSRLNRINRAYKSKPRKGVVTLGEGRPNQLNSFWVDTETGEIGDTQYMRNEERHIRRQQNIRNIKELAGRGIEFVRTKVLDPITGKPIYDENRHQVTIQVPATPRMLSEYRYILQNEPELAVDRIGIPREGVVSMWGDTVEVDEFDAPRRKSPERMYEELQVDRSKQERLERYFDNYRTLLDVTLPPSISDEMDEYIELLKYNGYESMEWAYELMHTTGYEGGDLEFFYLDKANTLSSRIQSIVNFWRVEIAPELGIDDRDELDMGVVEQELEEFGYEMEGVHPIFAEFNARRTDKPKRRRKH